MAHRGRLAIGLVLMLVSRLAALVPPASSKYLIDEVIGHHRSDLLVPLALAVGMSMAFRRLRPLFRDRGKITAEISGRLAESFGGIRIVKAYTAEEREDRVFAEGVDRLFQNVKQTLTGISAVTAFGSLVIGAIGVIMILVGGRSILAGTMTLGDLFMYIFFVGLLAAPMIQMSSIGTQLSEALAGLDRIREIK